MNAIIRKVVLNSQEKAYLFIREGIFGAEFKPGERLRAQELAIRLRLSRTPVREALGRLEQEGLVRRHGGWGYVVRTVSLREAEDVYKVRRVLELEAALEAMPKITDEGLIQLNKLLERAHDRVVRGRLREFRELTKQFHQAIAITSGNSCLRSILIAIENQVKLLGTMIFDRHSDRANEVVKENQAILHALRDRDEAAVKAAVNNHIERSWESFVRFVASEQTNIGI